MAAHLRAFFESLQQADTLGPAFLAALLQLARARARVDLRPSVTLQHADEIVELVRELLASPFYAHAAPAAEPARTRAQLSLPKKQRLFLAELKALRAQQDCFRLAELRAVAERLGLALDDFGLFVEQLNAEGALLSRGNGLFALSASL